MTRSRRRSPLTESEKQWQQQFSRKLQSLGEKGSDETAFLDPLQLELAEAVLHDTPGLSYTGYGGYPGAERVCLHLFPAGQQGSLPDVACILIEGQFGDSLTHRDFLGALLGLGLRRDQIGDILTLPGGATAAMVIRSKADFICTHLTRVGSLPVECSISGPGQLPLPDEEGKEISGTVASLRLDAVLSLGFSLSRSRVVLLIKGGLVKVNWRPVNAPSFQLDAGDLVSLQGRGRLKLVSLQGETRKGRVRLNLKKFN